MPCRSTKLQQERLVSRCLPESNSVKSFARKLIRMGVFNKPDIEQEKRAILKLCNPGHKNIICVLRLGPLAPSEFFFIDMEFCLLTLESYLYPHDPPQPHEPTPRYIKNAPVPFRALQIWQVMHHIVCGLQFMHNNKMIHRDLKPSNGISRFHECDLLTA
jgi:serine/threonine protein kinase